MINLFETNEVHKEFLLTNSLPQEFRDLGLSFKKNLIEFPFGGNEKDLLGIIYIRNNKICFEWQYKKGATKFLRQFLKELNLSSNIFEIMIKQSFISCPEFIFPLFEKIRLKTNSNYILIIGNTKEISKVYII